MNDVVAHLQKLAFVVDAKQKKKQRNHFLSLLCITLIVLYHGSGAALSAGQKERSLR